MYIAPLLKPLAYCSDSLSVSLSVTEALSGAFSSSLLEAESLSLFAAVVVLGAVALSVLL